MPAFALEPEHARAGRSGTKVASAAEDRLLMMLKQVEARVGAAVGALSDARPVQDEARPVALRPTPYTC